VTTFNLNNKIRVKLTDAGRQAHKANHESFWKLHGRTIEYMPPNEDQDGYSEWQLWSFMAAFGQHRWVARWWCCCDCQARQQGCNENGFFHHV